jgi:hypothetical protein
VPGVPGAVAGGAVRRAAAVVNAVPVGQGALLREAEQARDDVEEGAWRECAVGAVSPSPAAWLRAVAQLQADLRLRQRLDDRLERDRRERQALLRSLSWPTRPVARTPCTSVRSTPPAGRGWRRSTPRR